MKRELCCYGYRLFINFFENSCKSIFLSWDVFPDLEYKLRLKCCLFRKPCFSILSGEKDRGCFVGICTGRLEEGWKVSSTDSILCRSWFTRDFVGARISKNWEETQLHLFLIQACPELLTFECYVCVSCVIFSCPVCCRKAVTFWEYIYFETREYLRKYIPYSVSGWTSCCAGPLGQICKTWNNWSLQESKL